MIRRQGRQKKEEIRRRTGGRGEAGSDADRLGTSGDDRGKTAPEMRQLRSYLEGGGGSWGGGTRREGSKIEVD